MTDRREEKQGFIRSGMALGLGLVVFFILANVVTAANGGFAEKEGALEVLGVILAAGLTLAVYSFLYKDNPLFKLAEHVYLGVSVGYAATVTVNQYLAKQVYVPLAEPVLFPDRTEQDPKWALIIPVILGVFMLARFIPRYAWLSRYAFALTVGWGAGLMVPQVVKTYLFKQAEASVIAFNSSPDPWVNLSTAIVFVGVLSVLVYFFFSVKHEGPLKPVSRLGIWYLMVAFGATFGFTVMARISLLTGRVMFLLEDWLNLVDK